MKTNVWKIYILQTEIYTYILFTIFTKPCIFISIICHILDISMKQLLKLALCVWGVKAYKVYWHMKIYTCKKHLVGNGLVSNTHNMWNSDRVALQPNMLACHGGSCTWDCYRLAAPHFQRHQSESDTNSFPCYV